MALTKEMILQGIKKFPVNDFVIRNQIDDYNYRYNPSNETWFLFYNSKNVDGLNYRVMRYFNENVSVLVDSCVYNTGGKSFSLLEMSSICGYDLTCIEESIFYPKTTIESYRNNIKKVIGDILDYLHSLNRSDAGSK